VTRALERTPALAPTIAAMVISPRASGSSCPRYTSCPMI
jgi:hypothetical protein